MSSVNKVFVARLVGLAVLGPDGESIGRVRDAVIAQGMTPWQVLTRVELPLAVPVIMGGVRNAALQVISTTTVAAYINLGGLGRYLIDGLAVRDYPRMLVATLLVALLAFAVDALMGLVQRALTPAGLTINRKKA